jgi:hypothetical protein
LIAKYKKQAAVTQLKKVYSVLGQWYKLSELENGPFDTWDIDSLTPAQYMNQYLKPYFNIVKECTSYEVCRYRSNKPWIYTNGDKSTVLLSNETRSAFITIDGSLFLVFRRIIDDNTGVKLPTSRVMIDLNGPKGPNLYGTDVFQFDRVSDNGVFPSGYDKTETEINLNCNKAGLGTYCAAKIMQDGWQIRDDYPW